MSSSNSSKVRCPQCYKYGTPKASRFRGNKERFRYFLFPLYGVFRCHACNWRGWLYRSNASPVVIRSLIAFYSIIAVAILVAVIVLVVTYWPSGRFNY
jgi:hypothetical protein